MFPSGIHYVETYIDVTGRVASTFVVGAALGEVVYPLLISNLLEVDYVSFLFVADYHSQFSIYWSCRYITLGSFSMAGLLFVVLVVYSRVNHDKSIQEGIIQYHEVDEKTALLVSSPKSTKETSA